MVECLTRDLGDGFDCLELIQSRKIPSRYDWDLKNQIKQIKIKPPIKCLDCAEASYLYIQCIITEKQSNQLKYCGETK